MKSANGHGNSSARAVAETGKLLMTLCYAIHESFVYSRRTETAPSRRL